MTATDARLTYGQEGSRSDRRLQEMILHVADKCRDDENFGSVKLNKILYYSDFLHFAKTGRPITGARYMKIQHGPVPQRMVPVRDAMINAGKINLVSVPRYGKTQNRIKAISTVDFQEFTPDEIAFVDYVIEMLRHESGKSVSERTHGQSYDDAGEFGSLIPYESIFIADDQSITYDDILEGRRLTNQFEK